MKRRPRVYWLVLVWVTVSLACSLFSPQPSETPQARPSVEPVPALPISDLRGKIAYGSEREGTWQIISMNADGSDEISLTGAQGDYSRPAWSPDGNRIAMRSEISSGGISVMDVRHEAGRLVGSQPISIVSAFADGPSWSPDGKRLMYYATSNGSGWLSFMADLETGVISLVPGIPEHANDTVWSPDGNRIVFAAYTDPLNQVRDLYLVNADGSGLVQLTNTPQINESLPAWSPDGTRIAYSAAPRGAPEQVKVGSDIYIIGVDGAGPQPVTTHPDDDIDPAWSPDGKYIAFISQRHDNNDSNYEVYVIAADGTGEMRLTNNHFTDRWPTWRAEQPEDAPASACQPAISLVADVTIPAGTRFTQRQQFTKVWRVKNTGTCTWTPNTYSLRLVEGEYMGAQRVPVPGAIQSGATVDLSAPLTAPQASGTYQGQWQLLDGSGTAVPSSDGSPVKLSVEIQTVGPGEHLLDSPLYFIPGIDSQLFRLEIDGITSTQLTSEPAPVLSFDVSGQGSIAYFSSNQVIRISPSGQDRQVIATPLEGNGRPGLAWSADGSWLAYADAGARIHNIQTGEDRLLVADDNTHLPGMQVYEPLSWSPDGSKLMTNTYLWEAAKKQVFASSGGGALAELPMENATWSRDGQYIYYASSGGGPMMPTEGGLWRLALDGSSAQSLLSGRYVWWPTQAPDGSLLFFMAQAPSIASNDEYAVQLYRSDSNGSNPVPLNEPLYLSAFDTFNVRWSADAQQYAAHLARLALGTSEVLVFNVDGAPPVYLMQEIGQFQWEE